MKGLDDDSHVETRVRQYEAVKNVRGVYLAKQRELLILPVLLQGIRRGESTTSLSPLP